MEGFNSNIQQNKIQLQLKNKFLNKLIKKDILLEEVYSDEQGFYKTFRIHYKCKKFAVLRYQGNAKKRFSSQGISLFEIDNSILYSHNFNKIVKRVINLLGLKIFKVHRVDIAVDGYGFTQIADSIIIGHDWKTVKHRSEMKSKSINVKNGKAEVHTFGKSKSNKEIVIYPKGKDPKIIEKPYIIEFWQNNGLNPINVQRCELKLWKNVNDFSPNYKDWNTKYILQYFRSKCEDNLTFKIEREGKLVELGIIDFKKFPPKINLVSVVQKKQVNSQTTMKTTLRFLFREMENFGADYFACLEAYNAIIKKYSLYYKKYEYEAKWRNELRTENKVKKKL